jgi:hypothetical protein
VGAEFVVPYTGREACVGVAFVVPYTGREACVRVAFLVPCTGHEACVGAAFVVPYTGREACVGAKWIRIAVSSGALVYSSLRRHLPSHLRPAVPIDSLSDRLSFASPDAPTVCVVMGETWRVVGYAGVGACLQSRRASPRTVMILRARRRSEISPNCVCLLFSR